MTIKELALTLGVSQNSVCNIVKGYNFPKTSLLLQIAEELDVDIRELFIRTKEQAVSDPR